MKKSKIIISVKIQNFLVSRNLANGLNSEIVGICTFFEASSIGCHKTTCDVTKVIYNMYTCDTCCMSREMMEMDGLECAKCQNPREWTQMEL